MMNVFSYSRRLIWIMMVILLTKMIEMKRKMKWDRRKPFSQRRSTTLPSTKQKKQKILTIDFKGRKDH